MSPSAQAERSPRDSPFWAHIIEPGAGDAQGNWTGLCHTATHGHALELPCGRTPEPLHQPQTPMLTAAFRAGGRSCAHPRATTSPGHGSTCFSCVKFSGVMLTCVSARALQEPVKPWAQHQCQKGAAGLCVSHRPPETKSSPRQPFLLIRRFTNSPKARA